MKVLLLLPDISRIGGVERVVANLANLLTEKYGYEVTILSCFNENPQPAFPVSKAVKLDNLRFVDYPVSLLKKLMWYLKLVRPLTIYLKKNPHATILAEGSYLCITVSLLKIRGIVKIGCEHISFHAVNRIHKIIRRILYRRLNYLVVLTKSDKKAFNSFLPNVIHIPNFLTILPREGADINSSTIISAGRLAYQKGYDLLIESFSIVSKKHPDYKLIIFGEGEDRQKLEQKIGALNLGAYIFLPGATNDILNEFRQASVFVMSSRFEGFPMTLLEAMAAGLACISFNCPGPAEIIDHEHSGILVKENDTKGLAQEIIRLIEDRDERQRLARNAKIKAQQFSMENIGIKWKELFEKLSVSDA